METQDKELREILREFFNGGYQEFLQGIKIEYFMEKTIKQIDQWHKSERKKWALGLVGEDKKQGIIYDVNIDGYNEAKAEIRKKIEEG